VIDQTGEIAYWFARRDPNPRALLATLPADQEVITVHVSI
jgi:hypothetical protein